MKKQANHKQVERHKAHLIVVVIAVLVAGGIVFELSPFGGNVRFYAKWVQCGNKPVATRGSGYMNGGAKHYFESDSLPGTHPTIEYFCTPLEAELAGYSANPNQYEFPNINAQ